MILQFGEGKILIRKFAQGDEAGVILSESKQAHPIGAALKDGFQCVSIYEEETLSKEGVVLRFANIEGLDVLLEDLQEVREALQCDQEARHTQLPWRERFHQLAKEQGDLDPEIQKWVNEHFDDLLE